MSAAALGLRLPDPGLATDARLALEHHRRSPRGDPEEHEVVAVGRTEERLERVLEDAARPDATLGVEVVDDPYAACEGADALVVLTEWPEFGRLDLDRVADGLVAPRVVDTRNVLDRVALERRGFAYRGIGRT